MSSEVNQRRPVDHLDVLGSLDSVAGHGMALPDQELLCNFDSLQRQEISNQVFDLLKSAGKRRTPDQVDEFLSAFEDKPLKVLANAVAMECNE